jgi:hypothetical protein
METSQFYETTVVSEVSNHVARLLIVPSRSLPANNPSRNAYDLLGELALREIAPVTPANLGCALAVLFSAAMPAEEIEWYLVSPLRACQSETGGEPSAVAVSDVHFAETVAFEDIVPFERSPLSAENLAKLVTQAGGAGVGAYAGFVAFGASPLLLVMIPAGMILCGAAKGIADALEHGLRDKILHLMKVDRRRTETGKPSKPRSVSHGWRPKPPNREPAL